MNSEIVLEMWLLNTAVPLGERPLGVGVGTLLFACRFADCRWHCVDCVLKVVRPDVTL